VSERFNIMAMTEERIRAAARARLSVRLPRKPVRCRTRDEEPGVRGDVAQDRRGGRRRSTKGTSPATSSRR
jgi:hypothetical protein